MFLENVLDVLVEAEQYIRDLPFEAKADIWEAMRNYGKIHGDMDLEDYAEELMVELDPFEGTNKIIVRKKKNKIPARLPLHQNHTGRQVCLLVGVGFSSFRI